MLHNHRGVYMPKKIKGIEQLIGFFKPAKQRQIIKNTVNKLATDAKRETVKNITTNYNLSSRVVGPRLIIKRASVYDLIARIYDIKNRRLGFTSFKRTKQTREGISAEIRKGSRKTYPEKGSGGAFIRRPVGNTYRRQKGQPRTASKALPLLRETRLAYPLKALKAQTIAQMASGEWNKKLLRVMIDKRSKGYIDIEIVKALRKVI